MGRLLSWGERLQLLFVPIFILEEIKENRIRIRKLESKQGKAVK